MMIAPAFLLTQVDHLGHDVCNPRFTLLDWSTSRRNRWSTSPEYADPRVRCGMPNSGIEAINDVGIATLLNQFNTLAHT